MTSNEMIEHIAAELWRVQVVDAGAPASVSHRRTPEAFADHDDRTRDVFLRYAAAVLDLCGPKPLIWQRNGDHWACGREGLVIRKIASRFTLTRRNAFDQTFDTIKAAQAAAQAHYAAAHWANTPMGDV